MRIPFASRSFDTVSVPRWWDVLCYALAIALLAVLVFQSD